MNLRHLRNVMDEPDLTGTKYRLIEFLAAGGMGSVYVAHDTELDRRVALKVLRLPDPSGALTARMVREAKIVAQLEHPGIVPIHDLGRLPDERPFYVSKLVQGQPLHVHAQSLPDLPDRLRVFQRVCEAVAFAHSRGVLHRDLKPENILVGSFGEVLVMDWGVAKLLHTDEVQAELLTEPTVPGDTHAGAVVGTPGYMAPEQRRGDPVDARADVYTLGILLRSLSGQNPAKRLRAVIAKATAESPTQRYQAVSDLTLDISRLLADVPVSAYREHLLDRLWRLISRNWFLILVVLVYVIARVTVRLSVTR